MYIPYLLTTPLFYWLLLFTFNVSFHQVCFWLLHQLTCVDVLDFSIFLESYEPLFLPPHWQQVELWIFTLLSDDPFGLGQTPCAWFVSWISPCFEQESFLSFSFFLTTSLANIRNAFGMAEFVFNFYSCFTVNLVRPITPITHPSLILFTNHVPRYYLATE